MEERDSIKALNDQEMQDVLGGAVALGGWGKKYPSAASSSLTESVDELLEDTQKASKGTYLNAN